MADIGLAASAREWPDRVHRFLLDHGGGRIVGTAMGADQAMTLDCDVLIIDDVCSFLTPHLVGSLKRSGVEVIGVYQPEDGSDAKRRLLECGISDVIEAEAAPEEFVEKVRQSLSHRSEPVASPAVVSPAVRIGVTGATEGVGITEVAIGLADALSARVPTVLLDLDPRWPSVAQRLDLPVHPNIRTAVDHALHDPDRLGDALLRCDQLAVVGGRADGGLGEPISRHEIVALAEALTSHAEVAVADLGPLHEGEPGLVRELDTLILVGTADPVGVGRLLRTLDRLGSAWPGSPLVVLNMVPPGRYRRSEAMAEICEEFPEATVTCLPHDPSVAEAAWQGEMVRRGRFGKATAAMAEVVVRSLR